MNVIRIIWILAFIAGSGLMPAVSSASALLEVIRGNPALDFCGEKVPLEDQDVRERFERELLLTAADGPQMILWLKRGARYLPYISAQLKNMGMPDDLKYVAVAESALRPHIGSPKGAMGFWQLMPDTARKLGLTVDQYIDERRKLEPSTRAALAYLKNLHQLFSSWTLATAAYNMGEEGLTAEILEQKTRNYYQLYLSLETQRFIFRILAVKLVFSNPGAFGFELRPEELYQREVTESIILDCFQETPISLVAEAAGAGFKRIKDLNPHFRGHYLQQGRHDIELPAGSSQGFHDRFEELVNAYKQTRRQSIYEVQRGDSLSSIAAKFNIPLAALIIWNKIDLQRTLHPGDRLVIYPRQIELIEP